MTDTVIQLLRDRTRQGSTPGNRGDDARLVLLIEGGSSRGAYSSGMTVTIEQLGLLPAFDAVYGSSAGALNAAWLLCGRAESSIRRRCRSVRRSAARGSVAPSAAPARSALPSTPGGRRR
ncbi:patatin-like phospholipase family protein [Actinomycetes bacterium KLBMP 9759]